MKNTLSASLAEAGKVALADVGVDLTFDLLNPRVLDWLSVNALQHATQVNDTIKDNLVIRKDYGRR